jgi:Flp pilus assembly protein TadG
MSRNRVETTHPVGASARGERGAAAVEFALVLPILIVIVFGIINFGIVLAQKASLAGAVRTGARYGSVNAYAATHSCKNVIDKVRDSASTIGIGSTNNTRIGVTVYLVKPDNTRTTQCTAGVGDAFPGAATAAPCIRQPAIPAANPATPDTLTIETTFDSQLLIPTPGLGNSFNLSNAASFQCEYSK